MAVDAVPIRVTLARIVHCATRTVIQGKFAFEITRFARLTGHAVQLAEAESAAMGNLGSVHQRAKWFATKLKNMAERNTIPSERKTVSFEDDEPATDPETQPPDIAQSEDEEGDTEATADDDDLKEAAIGQVCISGTRAMSRRPATDSGWAQEMVAITESMMTQDPPPSILQVSKSD